MNVKQLKVHITRGIIRPEYFYLPLKAKKVLKNPFKYKVISETIQITFPTYLTRTSLNSTTHKMSGASVTNTVNARISWGDESYTDIVYSDREGYYEDSDGNRTDITTSTYNVTLSHTYIDSEEDHIVEIDGKCACVQLKGYPVAIVQWGDVGFECFYYFVDGSRSDSPCRTMFTIPNAPITGCANVDFINNMFEYTALSAVPDRMFTEMINLAYANWVFCYNENLVSVGDDICKGLTHLCHINYFFGNNPNLTSIGNSTFEGCTSIGAYEGMINPDNWLTAFGGNQNLKAIGSHLYKNCTGLQSLVPDNASQRYYYMALNYFPEACKCTIGTGMFEGCTELKDISAIFAYSPITFFPSDTFKDCTKIKYAEQTFYEMIFPFRCGNGIFDEMSNLVDIEYMFSQTVLDSIPKFPNSPITNLKNAFYNAGKGRGTRSVSGTNLPTLSGNNFYLVDTNGSRRQNMTSENINEYVETWHIKALDCTGMIPNVGTITDAHLAFYNVSDLQKQDENVPEGWSSYLSYNGIWFGNMTAFWNDIDPNASTSTVISSALQGCQGISNLDGIPDNIVEDYRILGFAKGTTLAGISNTELMRRMGDRLITEWSDS